MTEVLAAVPAHPRIEVGSSAAGLDPEALVVAHGSPLFVYDAGTIRARAALIRGVLPPRAEVAYAVKANPSPVVLATLAAEGLGADVASGGELRAVLRAGFDARRVVFTGPGKTDSELAAALRAGVGGLTIESLDELDALVRMAGQAGAGQGLLLRLATGGEGERTPIIGGDASIKFGLTDDEADDALDRLHGSAALEPEGPFRFRGVHAFGASNVLDHAVLVAGVRTLAERAERLAGRFGLTIELLDAGGGLGIPYTDAERPLDLEALGAGLGEEMETWTDRPALSTTRLLLEPGRWLTGPTGAYLCRVVRTKERQGRLVAVTDGGIHHLLRPRLVGQDHRVVPIGAAAGRARMGPTDVVGPLCTGLDHLSLGVPLPELRPGDLLAVLDAGAYGFTESMPFFLSHPIPAEVVVDGDRVTVSRHRVEPA